MEAWLTRALASEPAIVLYTVIGIAALGVVVAFSPIGKWWATRLAESRELRQIALLREFHEEMSPARRQEVAEGVADALKDPLPRLEANIEALRNEARARDDATEARLQKGSRQMQALTERQDDQEAQLETIERRVDGHDRKMERLGGALDVLTKSTK